MVQVPSGERRLVSMIRLCYLITDMSAAEFVRYAVFSGIDHELAS